MAADTLPVMGTTSARPRPTLVVQQKHDTHFDPAKHPRDRHGRFISLGDRLDLGAGHAGRVTRVNAAGSVTVKRDDGKTVNVKRDALKDTAVVDAPPPTSAPGPSAAPAGGVDTPDATNAHDGLPAGWSLVGASAKEEEWRNDARAMYDALLADGVELPVKDFDEYYVKVTARSGMTFEPGNDLTRKVGKTQVKLVMGDLPKEHWEQAARDVEAVVGGRNVKDELSVAFRSSSFAGQPDTLGYTTLGANHLEINPKIYTRTFLISTDNLMPSAKRNVSRYVIAHEYGHALGAGADHAGGVERAAANTKGVSHYGRFDPTEGAAEAYADWFMTDGASANEFTRAVADLEGWK